MPFFMFSTRAWRTDGRTDGPTDGRTDRPTDWRTDPLIEMRGRIKKKKQQQHTQKKNLSAGFSSPVLDHFNQKLSMIINKQVWAKRRYPVQKKQIMKWTDSNLHWGKWHRTPPSLTNPDPPPPIRLIRTAEMRQQYPKWSHFKDYPNWSHFKNIQIGPIFRSRWNFLKCDQTRVSSSIC